MESQVQLTVNLNDISTVVSLVPFPVQAEKPGLTPGNFTIPAANGTPTLLHVGESSHFVYLDEDRGHLRVRTPSNEVARSIVEDFINGQLRVSTDARPGIFWLPGALTLNEIKANHGELLLLEGRLQTNWLIAICKLADDDWQRYQRHSAITDFQRKAAYILGWVPEDHPWMSVDTVNTNCPACGVKIMPNVAICASCKCIINPEKAKQFQFAK